MILRMMARVLLVAVMAAATFGAAEAQVGRDLDARYNLDRRYNDNSANPFAWLFGARPSSSPIPRANVAFAGPYRPGTIVINTAERRLYLVTAPGAALRYGIGVGRIGFTWAGTTAISAKREWPDWTPPAEMLQRRPDLPRHMAGGPDNPLGARAMYLGSTLYRIHGSNEPWTIGTNVSSGCIRMRNEDVEDLYDRVKVGTKVVVI
jgi:lipoprotein-anchoring transpeptidase ErfK/SrfK